MGVFGLKASLVLNNGFNLIAAANGMLPYTETSTKPDDESIQADDESKKSSHSLQEAEELV
jgi:hypothetical protein